MKLLFDQNLSSRLVQALNDLYPGSTHVRLVGMERSDDDAIWRHARDNGFVIVTRDADFNERSVVQGYPPKIVWIAVSTDRRNTFAKSLCWCFIV